MFTGIVELTAFTKFWWRILCKGRREKNKVLAGKNLLNRVINKQGLIEEKRNISLGNQLGKMSWTITFKWISKFFCYETVKGMLKICWKKQRPTKRLSTVIDCLQIQKTLWRSLEIFLTVFPLSVTLSAP